MYLNWRKATPAESVCLAKVDRHCFDIAWEPTIWSEVIDGTHVRVGILNGIKKAVYYVGQYFPPEDGNRGFVQIVKLGVDPKLRNKGLSRAALADVRQWAWVNGVETKIFMDVPECLLYPGWDTFIGGWLDKVGFKPYTEDFRRDAPHSLYGLDFQHSYRFELQCKKA